MTETMLYGTLKGQMDYTEQLLSTNPARFEEIKKLAAKDGFEKFRIATIDLTVKPDFTQTLSR